MRKKRKVQSERRGKSSSYIFFARKKVVFLSFFFFVRGPSPSKSEKKEDKVWNFFFFSHGDSSLYRVDYYRAVLAGRGAIFYEKKLTNIDENQRDRVARARRRPHLRRTEKYFHLTGESNRAKETRGCIVEPNLEKSTKMRRVSLFVFYILFEKDRKNLNIFT